MADFLLELYSEEIPPLLQINARKELKTSIEKYFNEHSFDWKINLHDTGLYTATGGRSKKISSSLKNERCFLTYGDGLANVDLRKLEEFHHKHGKLATVKV